MHATHSAPERRASAGARALVAVVLAVAVALAVEQTYRVFVFGSAAWSYARMNSVHDLWVSGLIRAAANPEIVLELKPGLDTYFKLAPLATNAQGLRDGVRPPDGQTLYAGSIFGLRENTAYELKLSLIDPDGGNAERIVPMTTWTEPRLAADSPTIDAAPESLPKADRPPVGKPPRTIRRTATEASQPGASRAAAMWVASVRPGAVQVAAAQVAGTRSSGSPRTPGTWPCGPRTAPARATAGRKSGTRTRCFPSRPRSKSVRRRTVNCSCRSPKQQFGIADNLAAAG